MADPFETNRPLEEKHYESINDRIDRAARSILDNLAQLGPHGYYKKLWCKVDPRFRGEVRLVVEAYYPARTGINGEPRRHPFSIAAEKGLIVGSAFGTEALRNDLAKTYTRECGLDLYALRVARPYNPYDLEDIFKRSGEPTRLQIEATYGDQLFQYEGGVYDDRRADLLYANSVGYMAMAAVTRFTAIGISKAQTLDRGAICDMRDDLALLTDASYEFSLKDLD